jgi:uncharacterized protein (TIGR00661 family)
MRVLYGIQGTGNGHLSRAKAFIPALMKKTELDILVSGTQADIELPYPLDYKLRGLSFIFGKNGGIDLVKSINKFNPVRLIRDIQTLPVDQYDLVINDFEPVSAWACYFKEKKCIGLSHQAAVLHPNAPKTARPDLIGTMVLKYYAPVTHQYGFHFKPYGENIFTPVIRPEIRNAKVSAQEHVTVYLPAFSDERIIKILSQIGFVRWHVFSKHTRKVKIQGNIHIQPVSGQSFTQSLTTCSGVLCGAGFETASEALFLGKKLMVIPMKMQYEQQLNAEALKEMNVPSIPDLDHKHITEIKNWVDHGKPVRMDYPDQIDEITDAILNLAN